MTSHQGAGQGPTGDDFTIYIEGDQAGRNQAQTEADERRVQTVYASALYFRLADLALNSGLLIWQQLQYRNSWTMDCFDYHMKIWSTVWLGTMLLRSIIATTLYAIHLRYGRPAMKSVVFFQFLLEVFLIAWYLYGIDAIFVNWESGSCSASTTAAKAWSLFGWIVQSLMFFFPCILFICCVPCLLCLTRFRWVRERIIPLIVGPIEPSTNQMPTPETVLTRLIPTTFAEAVQIGSIDLGQRPGSPQAPPSVPNPGTDDTTRGLINSMGVGGLGHTVAGFVNRLNSSAASPQTIVGSTQELPTRPNTNQHASLTCPICVTEFAPEDEILQLPCDPRRHVFHASCVREWLRKSQHCPMCRTNLVEYYQNRDGANPDATTGQG